MNPKIYSCNNILETFTSVYVYVTSFFHFAFGIGTEPCWQTTNNGKGNKCQSQRVAGMSLTLTPIQRVMQQNEAGLLPQLATYVSPGGIFHSPIILC